MVVHEPDEDTVGELGDLDDEERALVAVVVDGLVEREEGSDHARDIGVGRDDVGDRDAVRDGLEDLDALPGAVDGHGAADDVVLVVVMVLVDGEAAGDGVVGGDRIGEGGLEVVDEVGEGGEAGRRREEQALLDVVGGEQGEVPGGERDALARPRRRLHGAPRHHLHR